MVIKLNLSNVYQVATVYSDDDVNKLLDNNWELLYITSFADTDERYAFQGNACQVQKPCFVLGATKEVANKFPKSKLSVKRYY